MKMEHDAQTNPDPKDVIDTCSFTVQSGEVIVGDPCDKAASGRVLLRDVECGAWFAAVRQHVTSSPAVNATALLCFHRTEFNNIGPDTRELCVSIGSGQCGAVDVQSDGDDEGLARLCVGSARPTPGPTSHGVVVPAEARLRYTPVFVHRTRNNHVAGIYFSLLTCERVVPESPCGLGAKGNSKR
jgi:hypothetical protein